MPELRPITDVKYYNGEVFVTGISNHRFASPLYRIPYPFTGKKATTTVEIWLIQRNRERRTSSSDGVPVTPAHSRQQL
jgi:hypothetical protein